MACTKLIRIVSKDAYIKWYIKRYIMWYIKRYIKRNIKRYFKRNIKRYFKRYIKRYNKSYIDSYIKTCNYLFCHGWWSRRITRLWGRITPGVEQRRFFSIDPRLRNLRTLTSIMKGMVNKDHSITPGNRKLPQNSAYHGWLSLGVKAMLAISAERGPTVRSRIRHSTGSRNLNVSVGVGTDISSCTSSGTLKWAVRSVMTLNMDACV